ncbi:diguanylate cyclase domain-containing protein [Vibrio sagamiensis]|uniref:GGDEF domain-containing protein n=1 Tax=Vibrio sagamiensis NBRC 104589 TaxID=1219064 RepID=A0A511QE00_9VIBR|nr:GGDEF domain-containing protein [Vibrio sagamiensis]GEM75397.1 hypothetical protein VSA01S_15090 [Vibrio sagamiensis NBRC 104589]
MCKNNYLVLFKVLILFFMLVLLSINIYSIKNIKSVNEGFSNRQNESTWYVFQLIKEYADFIIASQSDPLNINQVKLAYDITWSRFEILIESKVSSEFVKASNLKVFFNKEFKKFKVLELSIDLLEEGKLTKKDFLKRIYINYDTLIQFINNNFRLKSPVIENKSKVLNSIVSVFNWSGVLLIASIFITGCLYYSDFKRYKELQNLDQLTGFNNRFALMSFLKKASVNDAMFKIITVRIRNLREVNHQYGSEYGDLMLQFAANSLKGIVPEKGTSFRSSGSGFIFIFNNESNISKLLKDNFKDILSEYITVRRIDLILDVVIKYEENVEIGQILEIINS